MEGSLDLWKQVLQKVIAKRLKRPSNLHSFTLSFNSPAEDTKNEVHDKKGSKNNHWDKVAKLPCVTHGILDLKISEVEEF